MWNFFAVMVVTVLKTDEANVTQTVMNPNVIAIVQSLLRLEFNGFS